MELPAVSLIVLNYNGQQHLRPCLESIQAMDYPSDRLQVIVCDNHSSDGSVEFVRSAFPGVDLIELDANYGFGEGNNRAARKANHDWLAFLNNDMHVDRRWLREMVAPVASQANVACVSGKILNWDGTLIDFIGAGVNFQGFGLQWDHGEPTSELDSPRRLLCPCGGAMLIRKDLFFELGGFDPQYFAFFEDTDLGWRMNLLGHDVCYSPGAITFHRHHGTASRLRQRKVRLLWERNSLFTIYKCLDDENLAAALPATLLLLNEKALRIGNIDPAPFLPGARGGDDFEEGTREVEATGVSAEQGRPSLPLRAWRLLRRQGFASVLNRSLEMARIRRPCPDLAPAPRLTNTVTLSDEAVSPYVALSDFAHNLDRLQEQRRWIQERRVRTDDEMMELFRFALQPSHADPDYIQFHYWLLSVLGLDQRFGPGQTLTSRQAGL